MKNSSFKKVLFAILRGFSQILIFGIVMLSRAIWVKYLGLQKLKGLG
jgi:hypothetical protein